MGWYKYQLMGTCTQRKVNEQLLSRLTLFCISFVHQEHLLYKPIKHGVSELVKWDQWKNNEQKEKKLVTPLTYGKYSVGLLQVQAWKVFRSKTEGDIWSIKPFSCISLEILSLILCVTWCVGHFLVSESRIKTGKKKSRSCCFQIVLHKPFTSNLGNWKRHCPFKLISVYTIRWSCQQ